jgi:hypothetical protein
VSLPQRNSFSDIAKNAITNTSASIDAIPLILRLPSSVVQATGHSKSSKNNGPPHAKCQSDNAQDVGLLTMSADCHRAVYKLATMIGKQLGEPPAGASSPLCLFSRWRRFLLMIHFG